MNKIFLKILGVICIIFVLLLTIVTWPLIQKSFKPGLILKSDEDFSIVRVNKSQIPKNLYYAHKTQIPEEIRIINLTDYGNNINNVISNPNFTKNLPFRIQEKIEFDRLPKEIRRIFDDMDEKFKKERVLHIYYELARTSSHTLVYKDITGEKITVSIYLDIFDYQTYRPSLCIRVYKAREPNFDIAILRWDNVKKTQEKLKDNLNLTEEEKKEIEQFNRLEPWIQHLIQKEGEDFSAKFEENYEKHYKKFLTNLKSEIKLVFPFLIYHTFLANGERKQEYYPNNESPDKTKELFIVNMTDEIRRESKAFIFIIDKKINSLQYFELPSVPWQLGIINIPFITDRFILFEGCYYNKSFIWDTENGDIKYIPEAFGVTGVYPSPAGEKCIIRFGSDIVYGGNSLYENLAILNKNGNIKLMLKTKRKRPTNNINDVAEVIKPLGWADEETFYFYINNKYWKANLNNF